MRNIGRMIKELRLKRGWTVRKLASMVGKTPAYVSLIENKKRQISMELLEAFARALGVSPTYFLQERFETGGEEDLRRAIIGDLCSIVERYSSVEDRDVFRKVRRIPVISYTAAGEPTVYEDMYPVGYSDEFIEFSDITDEHAFALRIRGDSMEPLLCEGDIVVVSPASEVRGGKPVVIKTSDGEVTCKIYTESGDSVVLSAVNPRYPPQVYKKSDVVWVYPVVRSIRNFY